MLYCVLVWSGTADAGPSEPSAKLTSADHLHAVLEDKNPHSLWLLLARGAIAKVGVGTDLVDVNIRSAQQLIDRWAATDDYQSTARRQLQSLNIPRDWNAENLRRVAEFKQQFPNGVALETKYYHVLSTADPDTTKELAIRMNAVFRLYDRLFDFDEKIPYKCIIKFWKDRHQYAANGGLPGAAAHYSPRTKELVGYNTKALADTKHMDPYQIMFHEGWHQYFDFYIPGAPRWFDEGFAEVFAPTQIRRGRARMRRNEHGAKLASWLLKEGRLFPIRQLIRMSHTQFMASSDITYAQSYSFITFLMNFKHPDRKTQKAVRGFYKDYFWALRKGMDPVDAVDHVFGNVRLEVLEEMWKKSVKRQR